MASKIIHNIISGVNDLGRYVLTPFNPNTGRVGEIRLWHVWLSYDNPAQPEKKLKNNKRLLT